MSEASPGPDPQTTDKPDQAKATPVQDFIKIVPLPKIVFFYPTALAALICGIFLSFAPETMQVGEPTKVVKVIGWFFMAVFTANILIISFDFPGIKFLAVCFLLIALVLGAALTDIYFPKLIPGVNELIGKVKLVAGAHFYYFTFLMLTVVILTSVGIAWWTDVWFLHSNELVHKRGILGDVEKYPTINLRVTKEINDIFEFCLLLSGSLVLQPTTSDRPIVLENVVRINYKEQRIRDLLSKWRIDTT